MPDAQADPDETAIPARSSDISRVSAEKPGSAKALVLGSLGASRPNTLRIRRDPLQASLETVAQRRHEPRLDIGRRRLGRGPESRDRRDVLGSSPEAALLSAAPQNRGAECDPVRQHHDGAGTREPAELVGREEEDIRRNGVAGDPSRRLNGIADHDAAVLPRQFRDVAHRLENARLVIGSLDRHDAATAAGERRRQAPRDR